MARKILVYAKALIEITHNKPLPSSLEVKLVEGHDVEVVVRYS